MPTQCDEHLIMGDITLIMDKGEFQDFVTPYYQTLKFKICSQNEKTHSFIAFAQTLFVDMVAWWQ